MGALEVRRKKRKGCKWSLLKWVAWLESCLSSVERRRPIHNKLRKFCPRKNMDIDNTIYNIAFFCLHNKLNWTHNHFYMCLLLLLLLLMSTNGGMPFYLANHICPMFRFLNIVQWEWHISVWFRYLHGATCIKGATQTCAQWFFWQEIID